MRIPVYQMTYGRNQQGVEGLVFASERSHYPNQSILYTIPLTQRIDDFPSIIDYFEANQIYFPFLLKDEEIELEAKVEFPELVFYVSGTDFVVRFDIGASELALWPFLYPRNRYFKNFQRYVGDLADIIPKNIGFVSIMPTDLYEMDQLYMERKGVFVGLTPNFGNKERLVFNQ